MYIALDFEAQGWWNHLSAKKKAALMARYPYKIPYDTSFLTAIYLNHKHKKPVVPRKKKYGLRMKRKVPVR